MKQNKIQACDKYLADVRIVVINEITAVLSFLTRQKQFRSKSDLFASADGQHLPQCSTLFQERKDWPFNRCVHMKAKKTARKCNCLTRFSHRLQFPFLALFSDVLFIAIGVRQRSKHPKQGSCPRAVSRAIHFRQQLNLRFS